ncbi:putative methyltransferase-domain-containing protein [Zychaea mexicana]|uniref:putative methyltransferase-domain-containing protein n=1 Tax=Zychaea mexicana TaxID=64656 RepID=UPI0022FE2B31|nr:putative methyltransferase-domain-containing protein [Zychaea mexicana]KAI9497248.1 putative methyltransferase-domain-containing protein [Zychaea mexicana]
MDEQELRDTKSLATFSMTLCPSLSLDLCQLNNTGNHGTTVWDSAKVLAFYLMDTIKRPSWTMVDGKLELQNTKKCIELGSGCGLGGLTMAALGFDTVMTDLPSVVEHVLQVNKQRNERHIKDWWYQLLEQSTHDSTMTLQNPRVGVKSLDWLQYSADPEKCTTVDPPYNYILAADCIYCTEVLPPLLQSCWNLASPTTTILVALEHRDDIVVNAFVEKAKEFGFDPRMVPSKQLRTEVIGNEDIEIWKLKKKRSK